MSARDVGGSLVFSRTLDRRELIYVVNFDRDRSRAVSRFSSGGKFAFSGRLESMR